MEKHIMHKLEPEYIFDDEKSTVVTEVEVIYERLQELKSIEKNKHNSYLKRSMARSKYNKLLKKIAGEYT